VVTVLELRSLAGQNEEGQVAAERSDAYLERAGCPIGSPEWQYWRGLLQAVETARAEEMAELRAAK
jgi:hypothetical protein